MSGRLKGKRALVTGASRGIGRGIALALARAGADVAVGFRREEEAAREVVNEVEQAGGRACALRADVRDYASVCQMVEQARDTLGGLDVVVANAGVASRFEPVHEVEPSYWERVLAIDVGGVFYTLRAALPFLREQGGGLLLAVSSVAADACPIGSGPYAAAKAAVNALCKVVARENAPAGVRCNVISPGLIETEMAEKMLRVHGPDLVRGIPLGRMGTPDEVGKLAAYLASDDAAWITGQVFRIDGGQT